MARFKFYVVTITRPNCVNGKSVVNDHITCKVAQPSRGDVLIIHKAVEAIEGWQVNAIIPVTGFPKGGAEVIELRD